MRHLYGGFGFGCGFLMIVAFLFNFQEKPYVLFVGGIVCVMLNFVTNILLHIYGELLEHRRINLEYNREHLQMDAALIEVQRTAIEIHTKNKLVALLKPTAEKKKKTTCQ